MAFRRITVIVGILGLVVAASCQDPRAAALKLFTDQGLAVLQPARDYVKVGGLIVVATHGRPAYLEPYDTLPGATDNKPVTDFKALLLGQTVDTKVGLDVALNLAAGIVKLPVGLTAAKEQQVQMDQIDASGQRLIPTAVDTLAQKKATSDAVKRQLTVTRGNRVFMVQEVYFTKRLSVKSTSGGNLGVSYGSGNTVPNCSPASADTSKGGGTAKETTPTKNTDAAAKGTDTAKGTDAAKGIDAVKGADHAGGTAAKGTGTMKGTDNTKETDTTKSTDTTKGEEPAKAQDTATPGLSVGVCKTGSATLTIQSDNPIPFAVRLVELKLRGTDVLVQYTGFKFPGSLGASDTEKRTAKISEMTPVLSGLIYQKH
jgi:hypothetical protein